MKAQTAAQQPLAANTMDREAELAIILLASAQKLAPAYPNLRLFNLRYADDLTLICGYMVAPGEAPLLFASSDRTPHTIDRPIGMAHLMQPGDWRDPRQDAGQAIIARQCARMALTPAFPDARIIAGPATPALP